jgi:hypothetical protein
MILAIAALCEMVSRAGSLRRSLLIGCLPGQFLTPSTDRLHLPGCHAGLLGWVAVLLPAYLAAYPMLAAGLAWRSASQATWAWCWRWPGAGGHRVVRATCLQASPESFGVTLVDTAWRTSSIIVGTHGLSAFVAPAAGLRWL